MKLTRAAFMDIESVPDLAKTEVHRIPKPDDRSVPGRQPVYFLVEDGAPLDLRHDVVRRMLSIRYQTFKIGSVFCSRALDDDSHGIPARMSPDRIKHLSSDAKLRISSQMHAALR